MSSLFSQTKRLFSTASGISLNNLRDNQGAKTKVKRLGRGPGSGLGKTSGRGHKGQKARSGAGPKYDFEGGQTKLARRIPKSGFQNINALEYQPLNLDRIQFFIDSGRLDASQPIDMKTLVDVGVVSKLKWPGVKILSAGAETFRTPIQIEVSRASQEAINAIENAGGSVKTVYHNQLGLRALLKPSKFLSIPGAASAPPRMQAYYQAVETRGYLVPEEELQKAREENVQRIREENLEKASLL